MLQIYHGRNVVVSRPELITQNRFLDFGSGFYTTTNKSQAINFASKAAARRREGHAVLNIYTIDEQKSFRACKTLLFDGPDERGLDFVANGIKMRCLQMELIIQAKTAGSLSFESLHSKANHSVQSDD